MVQGLVRLILLSALLTGCATRTPPAGTPDGEPVTANTELAGSPALSLLERADQARGRGDTAAAGRYLERALNMAPDSSWLYRQLAELRLQEGDAHAAEGLALRALRLAPDNREYQAQLWDLVATSRVNQGDSGGARDARARARDLRKARA
ncbi:tetratricopeptide repeat protein [Alloalcanivorax mobilis]|uniref:tetratricopeptide repeat protein n=1 Tax=Alloalcanivorax mobilis TaxID=2019569 RepID=UPI000C760277|nr:tetratricopeptide repeat protein [Alloalcanivorax mobilis]